MYVCVRVCVEKAKANKIKQKRKYEKTAEKNPNKNTTSQTTPLERAAHHPNAPRRHACCERIEEKTRPAADTPTGEAPRASVTTLKRLE